MDIKNNVKILWNYLNDTFEKEEIAAGFGNAMEGFEYDPATLDDKAIDALSDDAAGALFFDMGYMAVNELFGGDFGTWYDVLECGLGFDAETIDLLEF